MSRKKAKDPLSNCMIYKEAKTEYEKARIRSAYLFARALQDNANKLVKYFEGTYGDPGVSNTCQSHSLNAHAFLSEALAARMALFEQKRKAKEAAAKAANRKLNSLDAVARKHR